MSLYVQALESLVPGLEVLPEQLPLSYQSLKQLISDNFRANKSKTDPISPGYSSLDQGFAALRALSLQAYLESCSSSATTDGVLIEATSAYSHLEPSRQPPSLPEQHWFKYRVRITNSRSDPIKVLGRGWRVINHLGEMEGYVPLSSDNAIVGQKPVIQPGGCFEYYSCTPLQVANGPGQMAGSLVVDLYEGSADSDAVQRVHMPVAPFKLQTADVAGAAGDSKGGKGAAADPGQASSSSSSGNRSRTGSG